MSQAQISTKSISLEERYTAFAKAARYIEEKAGPSRMANCRIGLVLGSGLGDYADTLQNAVQIPYNEIPGYPCSTVKGHAGKLVIGHLVNHPEIYVVTMKGRKHYYECLDMDLVTFPIRVFKSLGCKAVFTTNATGGINENFKVGDFMMITDQINMMPNPCLGPNLAKHGSRFFDMGTGYDPELQDCLRDAAAATGVELKEGVYLAVTGPSYETPAEIRMFRSWGGDNVGMSTAPEIIVARHCGMRCAAISCITNMAAGVIKGHVLNHKEVEEVARKRKPMFKKLLSASIERINKAICPPCPPAEGKPSNIAIATQCVLQPQEVNA